MKRRGRPTVDRETQQKIWDQSKTCTIRQLKNKFGLCETTIKKYANPEYM